MKRYEITFLRPAEKEFEALNAKTQRSIGRRIDGLAEDPRPRGSKKLKNTEDTYRIRVGVYRVLYVVNDREIVITVIRIRHRADAYRDR